MKIRQIFATALALSVLSTSVALAADISSSSTLTSAGVNVNVTKSDGVSTIAYAFEGVDEESLTAGSNRTVMVLPAASELTDTLNLIYLKQVDGNTGTTLAGTFTELKTAVDMPAGQSYKVCFGDSNSSALWDQFKFHLLKDTLTVSNVRKAKKTADGKTTYVYSVRVAGSDAKSASIRLLKTDGTTKTMSKYSYSFGANAPQVDGAYIKGAVKFVADENSSSAYTAILFGDALAAGDNTCVDLGADSIRTIKLSAVSNATAVNEIDVEENLLVFDVVDEDGNVIDVYDSSAEIEDSFFEDNAPEEVAPEADPSASDEFVEDEFVEEEFTGEDF